jgi:hypothetical protein
MAIPGERIILDINDRIDFGAYADLFRPSGGALVYKLYIGVRHHTNVSQGLKDPEEDQGRQKTFDSECRAYEIAEEDTFLPDRIPHSFRHCEIADVIEDDESIAINYLLPCCYAMEYIEGEAIKLRALVDRFAHTNEAEQELRRASRIAALFPLS